jgi:hypothetical protein
VGVVYLADGFLALEHCIVCMVMVFYFVLVVVRPLCW